MSTKDETGWVIECTTTGRLAYWAGPQLWSWEHMDAVRFARKEDAELVMRHPSCQGIGARVAEHMWCGVHRCPCPHAEASHTAPDGCWGSGSDGEPCHCLWYPGKND